MRSNVLRTAILLAFLMIDLLAFVCRQFDDIHIKDQNISVRMCELIGSLEGRNTSYIQIRKLLLNTANWIFELLTSAPKYYRQIIRVLLVTSIIKIQYCEL